MIDLTKLLPNLIICKLCEDYYCALCSLHYWECSCPSVKELVEDE